MTASPSVTRDLGVSRPLIDGEWLDTASLGSVEHINPATGRVNGTVLVSGPSEVDAAVAAAKAAYPEWRAMSPDKRRRILQRIEDLLEADIAEFAAIGALELGQPLQTTGALAYLTAGWFGYYAGWADKIEGATIPASRIMRAGLDYTLPEPYGVVGIILTWNGPLFSIGMKVAPALAAGNCVVVKTPDLAPYAVARFAELALEAGLPPGVLHLLPGGPEAGDALVRHHDVAKISFTGGIPTARKILDSAQHTLTPAVLELGGKAANLIFPDADLQAAVALTVDSCYRLTGQGCNLTTRMVVHREVYESAIELAAKIAGDLVVGDPFDPKTTTGPLINQASHDRVLAMIERVLGEGGTRLIAGGHSVDRAQLPADNGGGFFLEPTVIADVDPYGELGQNEVFGPVLSILPFDTEEEAVTIANATPYGLGAYLQTRDVSRVQRLVPKLEAGTVLVNGVSGQPAGAPFGGYKQSGHGREGGKEGLWEFLQTKNVFVCG